MVKQRNDTDVHGTISTADMLLATPASACLLWVLTDGRALTARELALATRQTSETVQRQLTRLLRAGWIIQRAQGRHVYFQLSTADTAAFLQQRLHDSMVGTTKQVVTGPRDRTLRKARVCYGHLAGELGVQLYDALQAQGYLRVLTQHDRAVALTDEGVAFFTAMGMDEGYRLKPQTEACRACLDWSERRDHLAGVVGKWIMTHLLGKGWASLRKQSRSVGFTERGLMHFKRHYGIH